MKWVEVEYYNGYDFDYKPLIGKARIRTDSIMYVIADVLGITPHIIIGFGEKEFMLTDESADRLLSQMGLSRNDVLYQGAYAVR